jgi:hypothetical protein
MIQGDTEKAGQRFGLLVAILPEAGIGAELETERRVGGIDRQLDL